ncbi:MAG: SBBP repeat-containing protein [Gemmatimonadales bacterium]
MKANTWPKAGLLAMGLLSACNDTTPPDGEPTRRTTQQTDITPLVPSSRGVSFATYLGGAGVDMLRDIAEGPGGRLYVAGSNTSGSFPVFGGFDQSFAGGGDGVVAALTTGGQRVWSTYFGARGVDEVLAIEVAPDGGLIVAGRAGPDLPGVSSGFQTTYGGGFQDGFVCRLSADGRLLYWCSYLGTGDDHGISDVAVDPAGYIYVVAGTERGDLPQAWFKRGMSSVRKGGKDAVLLKVAPNGSTVVWATYLGGRGQEIGSPTVRATPAGEVIVALTTNSSDLPTTPDAVQRSLRGMTDVWVARFNRDGALVFGTYLGGSGSERVGAHGLAIDRFGRVLVAGSTTSATLAGAANGFQSAFGGLGVSPLGRDLEIRGDGFVTMLSQTGRSIVASTYVGGKGADGIEAVSVDVNGVVWLSGATYSANFATTAGAHQPGHSGDRDGFVVALSRELKDLVYSTFLGTASEDAARAIVGRSVGGALVAGSVSGAAFPTMGALQPSYGGTLDGLVVGIR